MTASELQQIEDRLTRFSAWFDREEVPDYAWPVVCQDLIELERDVRALIAEARARL